MGQRLYLDNAATSFPKPPEVFEAMQSYAQEIGASAGRGGRSPTSCSKSSGANDCSTGADRCGDCCARAQLRRAGHKTRCDAGAEYAERQQGERSENGRRRVFQRDRARRETRGDGRKYG